MKKIASHIVAVIIGILLSIGLKSPRVEVVHHHKEVPVIKEVVKEVVKVVTKTKVVTEIMYIDPIIIWKTEYRYSYIATNTNDHLVQLLGGVGPNGLSFSAIPNGFRVKVKRGPVVGLGYQYRVVGNLQLGAQVLSNGTFLGTYGISF